MAINIGSSLAVGGSVPVDSRYVFATVQDALTGIPGGSFGKRYVGLTVFISSESTEYWFKSGITDSDFIIKSQGGGSGTTDYDDLTDKPRINNIELSGNKLSSDLGITRTSLGAAGQTDSTQTITAKNVNLVNGDIQLDTQSRLVGFDGQVKHPLVATTMRQVGQQFIRDLDIAADTLHLNLATNNDPEYGEHITIKTPSGIRYIPIKNDFNPESTFNVDSRYNNIYASDGSSLAPFIRISDALTAIADQKVKGRILINVQAGTDFSQFQLNIDSSLYDFDPDLEAIGFLAEAVPDVPSMMLGSLVINGDLPSLVFRGFEVMTDLVMSSTAPEIVFHECSFDGSITMGSSSSSVIRSFEKCGLYGDINIIGSNTIHGGFYECWFGGYAGSQIPALVVNNPNAVWYVSNVIDAHLTVHQGYVVVEGATTLVPVDLENGNTSLEMDGGSLALLQGMSCAAEEASIIYRFNVTGGTLYVSSNFMFDVQNSILQPDSFNWLGVDIAFIRTQYQPRGYTPRSGTWPF